MATYPGAVKSFTTKNNNDVIEPAHVNDLQSEVTAVEDALLNGFAHSLKWSTYAGSSKKFIPSTVTGTQNNFDPGIKGDTYIEWSGGADATITGFPAGTAGQQIVWRTTGAFVAYFVHQSGSSTTKLYNMATSGNTPVNTGGFAVFIFDGTYWVLVSHDQGTWITPAFSGSNYTGDGTITWTVDSGDVSVQRYRLVGRTLFVAWRLNATSTGGTASNVLRILNGAYGGFTAVFTVDTAIVVNDAGAGYANGIAEVSTTYIGISKSTFGNWSNASVNNTYAFGEVYFEVV